MDLLSEFDQYESAAIVAIGAAKDAAALESVRIEFLGARRGRLKDLQSSLGKAPPDQKPLMGKRFNEVKNAVTAALESKKAELSQPQAHFRYTASGGFGFGGEAKAYAAGDLDMTLPGIAPRLGRQHPLTQTIDDFKAIMGRFGFTVTEGPEIEDEFHNFEALNIPADHPARDPLENFYLATADKWTADGSAGTKPANAVSRGPMLLRSQTSTVQIRVMEQTPPPIRIISIGRVYRPDTIDQTHSCMFHQMEGLMVGDSVTMAELKTVLRLFAQAYLGHDVHIRFRPSFFPFTEPSVEVDMSWGKGGQDWLEIGGAGMVDPHVLSAVGYDPERVSGFAFGLGVERFCMRRHGVPDIRLFTSNDVRFLKQF